VRSSPVIVWFRNDLRIADNPALTAAAETGAPVVALDILDDAAPDLLAQGAQVVGGYITRFNPYQKHCNN